jgi:sugar/nucleoside kinase (ribokinase family)
LAFSFPDIYKHVAELYTLGNFTIDDIVLHDGRTFIDTPGGNALYSALGAHVWLERVGLLARVGNDLPPTYLDTLAVFNLEIVPTYVPFPNIHDWALYEPDGTRQFVNHRQSGANDDLSIRAADLRLEQCRARAYHIAPMPTAIQSELAQALKRADNFVSLDPHEWWIKGNETVLLDLVSRIDFFLPSREQAELVYGRDDPERAVCEFARHVARAAVVKLGAAGSLVYDVAQRHLAHIPIYPARVVDVTGAGDAYCGGFLAGYLETHDAVQAACYGTVSASFCIEHLGALSTKTRPRSEAEQRLAFVREHIQLLNTLGG